MFDFSQGDQDSHKLILNPTTGTVVFSSFDDGDHDDRR